jgi:hypothetical protein
MDVKQYYRKIREAESRIIEDFPLVVSLETADGGKAGVVSEVSRGNAAKMMVEGRAALATEEQKQAYSQKQAEIQQSVEKAEFAKRLQVAIVSEEMIASATRKKIGINESGK